MISVGTSFVWSASHDRRILVWNTKGDNVSKLSELNVHSSKINCLVQTSKYIWSLSSDKSIFVWDKFDRKIIKEISNAHDDSVLCGTCVGDGIVTGSASLCKTLRTWKVSENLSFEENDHSNNVNQKMLGIFPSKNNLVKN